jgi:hypothetical protein
MKTRTIQLLLTVVLLHFCLNAFAYTLRVKSSGDCPVWGLLIDGDILAGSASTLAKGFVEAERRNSAVAGCRLKHIDINSKGGDVEEALAMGRMIRAKELDTRVEPTGRCLSSCVLILGAGVWRMGGLNVGIHRPYFTALDPSLSVSEIRRMREQTIAQMKAYAAEMDFSVALIDDMIAIPPEQIKMLTQDDQAKYRLNQQDANYDERQIARAAQDYGLTSSEYRRRDATATRQCGNVHAFGIDEATRLKRSRCTGGIMWNLSESDYTARVNQVKNKCDFSDARDQAVFRACLKKVMTGSG